MIDLHKVDCGICRAQFLLQTTQQFGVWERFIRRSIDRNVVANGVDEAGIDECFECTITLFLVGVCLLPAGLDA